MQLQSAIVVGVVVVVAVAVAATAVVTPFQTSTHNFKARSMSATNDLDRVV